MKLNIKFDIATKLILATVVILMTTIVVLSYRSTEYFDEVSHKKEIESNFNSALAKANETSNILQSLLEKSKTVGTMFLSSQNQDNTQLITASTSILENDKDIIVIDIYTKTEGSFSLKKSLFKKNPLPEVFINDETLDLFRKKNPFPVTQVSQGMIEINRVLLKDNIPLMALGMPIERNDFGQVSAIVVTYFQLSKIQRIFSVLEERKYFLVDSKGSILAHPNENFVVSGKSFNDHPAVLQALNSPEPRGKLEFMHPIEKQNFKGAFVKTPLGPVVVSEISDDLIYEPVREARRSALLIAGIVLSFSVFLIFIFSLQFSSPIEKLAALVRRISEGDLDFSAQEHVKSKDEVGELAKTFDEMLVGLRERAKAFAVMRQALGKNVITTLMNMKDEELGGQRKPVAVLFSDLRDFTKFSEGHSPEEVVLMLNEYFDVMVKIIEKHNGWLDKFIGDAIMAVWGVPYTNVGDNQRAVLAALDMRIALNELNENRIARGLGPIKIGVGLHCGDAIVGKIGATERANLTVIGDTVNQASRIEAATKAFGVDILLSQEMIEQLGTLFWTESVGSAEVKGKVDALKLFKIRGYKDNEQSDFKEVKTPYSDYRAEGADKIKVA